MSPGPGSPHIRATLVASSESCGPVLPSTPGSCAFIASPPAPGTKWEEGKPSWERSFGNPPGRAQDWGDRPALVSCGPWPHLSLPMLHPVGKSSSHHQDAHRSGLQGIMAWELGTEQADRETPGVLGSEGSQSRDLGWAAYGSKPSVPDGGQL